MPTQLTPAQHLDGLRTATAALVEWAERAGLDARVPTCPDWRVRDLVAHQGMVHRWAAALVRGEMVGNDEAAAYEREGQQATNPLSWLADGAGTLIATIAATPDDRETVVFLNDAPPGRAFWARRQCHETTIHAVDACAAALGRRPRADEVWVQPAIAADGIDELLGGFLTRPRSRLRCDEEAVLVVAPDDVRDWWEVSLGPRPAVTTRRTASEARPEEADWELTGGAVELYLRLWNRGAAAGSEPEARWRALTAINWT